MRLSMGCADTEAIESRFKCLFCGLMPDARNTIKVGNQTRLSMGVLREDTCGVL